MCSQIPKRLLINHCKVEIPESKKREVNGIIWRLLKSRNLWQKMQNSCSHEMWSDQYGWKCKSAQSVS